MNLTFLGGAGEVGRSGLLVDNGYRVLLDYGIKLHEGEEYPLRVRGGLDAVVITHAHLDHSGFLPAVYDNYACPWFATYPTQLLSNLLLKDSIKIQKKVAYRKSSFNRAMKHFVMLEYGVPYNAGGASVTLHDAGHITGSSLVHLETKGKSLLYTGDFKLEEMRMEKGADVPRCDVLVTESTYSQRDHPSRKDLERKLSREIKRTLEKGGNILLPSFAVGRSQELLQILYSMNRDAHVYLDGMAKTACELVRQCPNFVKDYKRYEQALDWVEWVDTREQRAKALRQPSVVITTAGMMNGGPVLQYLLNLSQKSKVMLTGYCVDDTNGWHLLNSGVVYFRGKPKRVEQEVQYLDFSAHAGREDLLGLIRRAEPEKIFCVHGDHTGMFAEQLREKGYDAYAPRNGEQVTVV